MAIVAYRMASSFLASVGFGVYLYATESHSSEIMGAIMGAAYVLSCMPVMTAVGGFGGVGLGAAYWAYNALFGLSKAK